MNKTGFVWGAGQGGWLGWDLAWHGVAARRRRRRLTCGRDKEAKKMVI